MGKKEKKKQRQYAKKREKKAAAAQAAQAADDIVEAVADVIGPEYGPETDPNYVAPEPVFHEPARGGLGRQRRMAWGGGQKRRTYRKKYGQQWVSRRGYNHKIRIRPTTAGEKYFSRDLAKALIYANVKKTLDGKRYGLIANAADADYMIAGANDIKDKYLQKNQN